MVFVIIFFSNLCTQFRIEAVLGFFTLNVISGCILFVVGVFERVFIPNLS